MHSDDARGKFANSIVFIGWKGIMTARRWLKPANPKSDDQGSVRGVIGNLGRAVGKVVKDSAFHDQLIDLDLIPDRQSKQSYLVQYIKDNYIGGKGATMLAAYTAQLAEYAGSSGMTSFSAAAADINLTAFVPTYGNVTSWEAGLGLYLIGKAAVALGFLTAPYTSVPTVSGWTAKEVYAMVADMTGSG